MPYSVTALPELSAIEVKLSGKLTIEDLRRVTAEVLLLADETRYRRALADCHDYVGGASLGQVFSLTRQLGDRPVASRGVEAFIAPADPRAAADVQFYVNMTSSTGTRAQMFPTRQAAIEWMLKSS
jgi:hypothetical protein